ncbi:GNAT family N-acetyltransferase [Clostridium akagii]|uniref:GNAT family N-acetyltransferase n=1 Tax=Clostridium akagii TaxID=91623 RepID=UPI00047BFB41|nr:GNAT family N-acetyltransferase [Clostridium akagii]
MSIVRLGANVGNGYTKFNNLNNSIEFYIRPFITETDLSVICDMIYKNFNTDMNYIMSKYAKVASESNKYCFVACNSEGILGYIQFSIFNKLDLVKKYPKAQSYLSSLTGDILYISELIVLPRFRNSGVASNLLEVARKGGIKNSCSKLVCFAVKDGVNGIVNAKGILNRSKFKCIATIVDAWNQSDSKDNVNYCPICKGHSNICKCEGVIYEKEI